MMVDPGVQNCLFGALVSVCGVLLSRAVLGPDFWLHLETHFHAFSDRFGLIGEGTSVR